MKIAIKKSDTISGDIFDGEEYVIDISARPAKYCPGDLICFASPWGYSDIPLTVTIAIRADGTIYNRGWKFTGNKNPYLHTDEISAADADKPFSTPFKATPEQIDTVNGLFSGRIRFEGLKLMVGQSVQKICPIDVSREEELLGGKIYLA